MIQFYEIYKENQKVRTLSAQLSWTNNLLILRGTKTIEEKEFYIRLCIKIIIHQENLIDKYKVITTKDFYYLMEML